MYIIQEIQTENNKTSLLPALTYADRHEAESAYYSKLASACISSVDVHTVIMYDEHGNQIMAQYIEHLEE